MELLVLACARFVVVVAVSLAVAVAVAMIVAVAVAVAVAVDLVVDTALSVSSYSDAPLLRRLVVVHYYNYGVCYCC